jgi:damage-control phosphatase, subfamily I
MQTYNDCIPCLVKLTLDAARKVTSDEQVVRTIINKSLKELIRIEKDQPPPVMASIFQKIIRQETGVQDPYKKEKQVFNDFALKLFPELQAKVKKSTFPLETATRLAIAGNIIDFGIKSIIHTKTVLKTIEHALACNIHGDIKSFTAKLCKAENILWLADNTGEIVFDLLLMEELCLDKITFAVRGYPIFNDATREDALATGIAKKVKIIDNGSNIPGTLLKDCSKEFCSEFLKADLIIAKGQGNYETLPHDDARICFLFKAKCKVISKKAGCDFGDIVIEQA